MSKMSNAKTPLPTRWLARAFRLAEHQSTVRTEVLAGLTTFLTMSYIIFVQPAVLSGRMFGATTGLDFGAVMTATCLAAAIATMIMALWARYPIGQAPGMGENFFFVFSVIPAASAAGFSDAWEVALGVVFVSGILFLLVSISGLREPMIDAISPSLKNAIAAGIGMFIAFIGLKNGGLIVKDASTGVGLNPNFLSPDVLIFLSILLFTAVLQVRGVRGAILWGILAATGVALVLKWLFHTMPPGLIQDDVIAKSVLMTRFVVAQHVFAPPPSIAPTFLRMDLLAALSSAMIPFVIVFLVMDLFDTLGTIIGVSEQAGFIKDNRLPRANRALLSDAIGTVVGASLGTSTVTSFIESASGVAQGGRTGLTGLVVAVLFLLALFISPIVAMVGSYPPITAPALVIVGSMMMGNVTRIKWAEPSEAIPAFVMLIAIPLTYSISDGLALGFVTYAVVKIFGGRVQEVTWFMVGLALLLLVYLVVLRPVAH
jgi:AGZA family xanthine/uracil permease-like MFS transporter